MWNVHADVNQVETQEEDALWNWDDDESTCTPNPINCCQLNESIDILFWTEEEDESSDLYKWIIFQGQKIVLSVYIDVDRSASIHYILIFSFIRKLTIVVVKQKN
jgi:hypothetical protein